MPCRPSYLWYEINVASHVSYFHNTGNNCHNAREVRVCDDIGKISLSRFVAHNFFVTPAIENKVVVFLTRKKVFFGVVLGCHLTVMNGKNC